MTVDKLKKALSKEGLRYTEQRQAVWDELCSNDEHRDAEEIYLSLKGHGLKASRATVYRTIDVLVKNDLVRKLELGDGKAFSLHNILELDAKGLVLAAETAIGKYPVESIFFFGLM